MNFKPKIDAYITSNIEKASMKEVFLTFWFNSKHKN